MLLQLTDVFGNGRLTYIQFGSGLGEIKSPCYGIKNFQTEIEHWAKVFK
jgi:hypothetical protein